MLWGLDVLSFKHVFQVIGALHEELRSRLAAAAASMNRVRE